jgi:hypothetical protein
LKDIDPDDLAIERLGRLTYQVSRLEAPPEEIPLIVALQRADDEKGYLVTSVTCDR